MAKDDMKRALEAMVSDEAIAEQMAAGDFSGVDGLDLTPDEQTLLRDAAADLPDVAGFGMDMLFTGITIKQKTTENALVWEGNPKFDAAYRHIIWDKGPIPQ